MRYGISAGRGGLRPFLVESRSSHVRPGFFVAWLLALLIGVIVAGIWTLL